MEKTLELSEVALVPATENNGATRGEYNFCIQDILDKSISLPIFTSPMPAVVDERNYRVYTENGIKPVIPRTSPLSVRLEAARYIFAAFSIKEVIENFIRSQVSFPEFLRICIDCGNGQDLELFKVGSELKRMYNTRVIIMGGNLGTGKAYLNYCKAGFDYVRVGLNNGSLVNSDKYGFYYPIASLLQEIASMKEGACRGLKLPMIIVDGGITEQAEILKSLALGADYVMLGRPFASMKEAAGDLHIKDSNGKYVPIPAEDIKGLDPKTPLWRRYEGNTLAEIRVRQDGYDDVHDWLKTKPRQGDSIGDWVRVKYDMKTWMTNLYDVFSYGFMMGGAKNWDVFKKNVRVIRI